MIATETTLQAVNTVFVDVYDRLNAIDTALTEIRAQINAIAETLEDSEPIVVGI